MSFFICCEQYEKPVMFSRKIMFVRYVRGNGLEPKYLDEVLGKKAAHDIERGTPLSFNDILE